LILGALENDKSQIRVTELGDFISKLQVEPKIGKVIFTGLKNGILESSLYLAAALEISSSVWLHFSQLDKKKKIEMINKFSSSEFGDVIPLIPILKKYELTGMDPLWCKKKQLHSKFCSNSIQMKNEIKEILLRSDIFVQDSKIAKPNDLIQLLLCSFPMNLCKLVKGISI
jgi:HrpA-like RNA helicase